MKNYDNSKMKTTAKIRKWFPLRLGKTLINIFSPTLAETFCCTFNSIAFPPFISTKYQFESIRGYVASNGYFYTAVEILLHIIIDTVQYFATKYSKRKKSPSTRISSKI